MIFWLYSCKTESVEETKIFAQLPSVSGTVAEKLVGSIQTGFVTDAKTFHWRGFDYIVIAQLFDKSKNGFEIDAPNELLTDFNHNYFYATYSQGHPEEVFLSLPSSTTHHWNLYKKFERLEQLN